jgi:hypothetical protein
MVETSTFGSKFVVTGVAMEMIEAFLYKLVANVWSTN